MLHENFQKNWKKILDFNKAYQDNNIDLGKIEPVRIPFTPIDINPKLLYQLFNLLYPEFINDQQNVADLIISDNEEEILQIKLYSTSVLGIHDSFIEIENKVVKLKRHPINEMEDFFSEFQKKIKKANNLRISHVRVIKQEGIKLLNQYLKNIEDLSFNQFIEQFLNLLQKLFLHNLFFIHPKPNILYFLEELFSFLEKVYISDIFKFISEILPQINSTMLIDAGDFSFILKIQSQNHEQNQGILSLELRSFDDYYFDLEQIGFKEKIIDIRKQLDTNSLISFKLEHCLKFLTDLFETDFPLKFDSMSLLLQKIIYAIRSFNKIWFKIPVPKIYNPLIRFLFRLFGFHINLRKLSHWEIPKFIFSLFVSNYGLYNNIAIIITDKSALNKEEFKNIDYKIALLFTTKNRSLHKIIPISLESVLKSEEHTLENIREVLSANYGHIDGIISIDKSLLSRLFKNYLLNLTHLNLKSKLKTINELKKKSNFNIYPANPHFQYIQKKNSVSLIRKFLPIFIDKHEF